MITYNEIKLGEKWYDLGAELVNKLKLHEQITLKTIEMRKAQDSYFSTRSGWSLTKAKLLEKEVDKLITELHTPFVNQKKLF